MQKHILVYSTLVNVNCMKSLSEIYLHAGLLKDAGFKTAAHACTCMRARKDHYMSGLVQMFLMLIRCFSLASGSKSECGSLTSHYPTGICWITNQRPECVGACLNAVL